MEILTNSPVLIDIATPSSDCFSFVLRIWLPRTSMDGIGGAVREWLKSCSTLLIWQQWAACSFIGKVVLHCLQVTCLPQECCCKVQGKTCYTVIFHISRTCWTFKFYISVYCSSGKIYKTGVCRELRVPYWLTNCINCSWNCWLVLLTLGWAWAVSFSSRNFIGWPPSFWDSFDAHTKQWPVRGWAIQFGGMKVLPLNVLQ